MQVYLGIAGLGLSVLGALILAMADAWFSQSVLVYLDVVEANLSKLVEFLRDGGSEYAAPVADLKRDRGQNRARTLKFLGWAVLILGFLLQLGAMLSGSAPLR